MCVAVHGVCDMVPDPDAPYNVTGTVDFVQAVVSLVVPRGHEFYSSVSYIQTFVFRLYAIQFK